MPIFIRRLLARGCRKKREEEEETSTDEQDDSETDKSKSEAEAQRYYLRPQYLQGGGSDDKSKDIEKTEDEYDPRSDHGSSKNASTYNNYMLESNDDDDEDISGKLRNLALGSHSQKMKKKKKKKDRSPYDDKDDDPKDSTKDPVPGNSACVVPAGLVPDTHAHATSAAPNIVVFDLHVVVPARRVPHANIHIICRVVHVVAADAHVVVPTRIVARPDTHVGSRATTSHLVSVDLHVAVAPGGVADADVDVTVRVENAVLVDTASVVTAGVVTYTQTGPATSPDDIIVGDVHVVVSACAVVHPYLDVSGVGTSRDTTGTEGTACWCAPLHQQH
ncbi:hypothetical protein J5N97_021405 [Dioscorea zingiberensis]|uniref:Uncharacterized protein n=1 Tax=Dioscorea zingiberensis TaxID=325984 RepID=A0A9D5CHI9_9LILI|nr:hypothetical protein J5N97_021405 [Dioscorea zingiberensis]